MPETNRRHFREAQLPRRRQATMPGDYLHIGIDQQRHVEAERFDAAGDLPDLLLAVDPGVGWVGLQQIGRKMSYIEGGFKRASGSLASCKVRMHGDFP